MSGRSETRSTGWSGIAILLLAVAPTPLTGSLVKPFPYWSDSTASMARYFADNRAQALVQVFTFNMALVLLLWFAAGLRQYLSNAGGLFPRLVTMAATAGAVCCVVLDGLYGTAALAGTPGHPLSEALLRTGFDGSVLMMCGGYGFFALMLVAAGIEIRRTGALPAWLATSAFVLAAWQLMESVLIPLAHAGPLVPYGWLSMAPLILLFAWTAAAGVALLRATTVAASPTHTAATTPA